MVYKKHNQLALIEVTNDTNTISFGILEKVILERPSNMIYCEQKGKLYGIISMGDIARARDEERTYVYINRKFTCISESAYMEARKIFLEKETINAIPVVSGENVLVGAYLRWDNSLIKFNIGGVA